MSTRRSAADRLDRGQVEQTLATGDAMRATRLLREALPGKEAQGCAQQR